MRILGLVNLEFWISYSDLDQDSSLELQIVDTKTVSWNRNAGNATFCLSGTGTGIHSGSYSGSKVKWNTKDKR